MAEIKIEKKKPIWPWIVGLLLVLAVIIFLFYASSKADADDTNTNPFIPADTISSDHPMDRMPDADTGMPAYQSSTTYLGKLQEQLQDSSAIGTDTIKTTKALYNLAYATTSKAVESNIYDSNAFKDLEKQLEHSEAEQVQLKSMSTDITNVIETIQTKRAPNLESNVTQLKTATQALSDTAAWAKQDQNIKTYLMQAYEILANI
ncbi:hypothetical protein FNB79_11020 [Formosa sediminum]|uniref:Uncharacterized protein n=1 Tax=Formosa sediminum TaxID=2594004 RepID=A0A516GSH4_9FLAO|nr:hypothetical protein [Formosa sediminum]QDO94472.1 hypothetical protein FNB79_11020 [Formosa sediminum]